MFENDRISLDFCLQIRQSVLKDLSVTTCVSNLTTSSRGVLALLLEQTKFVLAACWIIACCEVSCNRSVVGLANLDPQDLRHVVFVAICILFNPLISNLSTTVSGTQSQTVIWIYFVFTWPLDWIHYLRTSLGLDTSNCSKQNLM